MLCTSLRFESLRYVIDFVRRRLRKKQGVSVKRPQQRLLRLLEEILQETMQPLNFVQISSFLSVVVSLAIEWVIGQSEFESLMIGFLDPVGKIYT